MTEERVVKETGLPPSVRSANRDEGPWLARLREEAWGVYLGTPLPSRSAHLWRYTDPAEFVLDPADLAGGGPVGAGGKPAAPSWAPDDCAATVVLQGGAEPIVSIGGDAASSGLEILSLREAAARHPGILEERVGSLLPPAHGKFEALAAAIWSSGCFLRIPDGVELAKPIHVLHGANAGSPSSAFRFAAILGRNAKAILIEEHAGGGPGPSRVYGLGELFVGEGGSLRHVVIQRFPDGVISHVTYRTRVDRGGSHRPFIVSLGGRLSKFDVGTLLAGDGSETELLGVVFGAKGQRFDHHTVHDHAARNTRSNLEMRVVLTDRAQSAYTGLIRIGESAPFAEAYQENRNLVLSKRAKAETIPELEISTDEVRCKHGATVGPVDEDQIFYLMSRGIPWTRAVRMIVRGFVDAVLDRAPTDLKAKIGETVEERLRHIS